MSKNPRNLFQPRGHGYAFRISIPPELQDQFRSSKGKVRKLVVEGLKTKDQLKAVRAAIDRKAYWEAAFEKARLKVPLTLGEIDDAARDARTDTLARLAAENDADDATFVPFYRDARREAIESGDATLAEPDIKALERRTGPIDRSSPTFRTLALAILRAQASAYEGRLAYLEGRPSAEPASFLGQEGIDPTTLKPLELDRAVRGAGSGPWGLFETWVAAVKPAVATVGRWRVVFLMLQKRFGEGLITENAAQTWLDGLVGQERGAYTVDNIYLSAARRIYAWALKKKLVDENPFKNCWIEVEDEPVTRGRSFTPEEVDTILKAATASDPASIFGGAKRWCPWLAAYSGARMGEICQLRSIDVRCVGGVWFMELTPDAGTIKSGIFRQVPLHSHLVEQGFLNFARGRKGPLFYNARAEANDQDSTKPMRPRQVKTRERLAAWVRALGVDDKRISPNHAWRHRFKLEAERAGIPERLSDYLTGHVPATEGRAYGAPLLSDLAREIEKLPRYTIEGN